MYSGCCNRSDKSDEKKEVTFVFKRDELIYDIRNYAYIEGHVLGEDAQHGQHTLVEIGEEGNIDRVTRILGVVHAAAVEMLYPYTKKDAEDSELIVDELWEPTEYVIKLLVPSTMSRTTLHLLHKLIHEFMVYRVLYDWLSITNKDAAENWLNKSMEAETEINKIKNTRTKVLLRKGHPF